jgi:hypothetical protein
MPKSSAFDRDVFPFPQITPASSSFATAGHKNVGVWGAWGACPFGVSNDAQKRGHADMAKDFLYFYSSPKRAGMYCQDSVYVPLAKGLTAKGSNALETTKLARFSQVMGQPCALSTAEIALGPAVQLQRCKMLQSYLTGQISLSGAMDQMQLALTRAAKQARRWLAVAQKT